MEDAIKVSINTTSLEEIAIGQTRAREIISQRPFRNMQDLRSKVPDSALRMAGSKRRRTFSHRPYRDWKISKARFRHIRWAAEDIRKIGGTIE